MVVAFQRLVRMREGAVSYWDRDWVLLYNKSLESQWGGLFSNRWNGPYRVAGRNLGGSYNLEEADGTPLSRRAAASHVKRFYPKGTMDFDDVSNLSDETEGDKGDDGMEEVEEIREDRAEEAAPPCRSQRLRREVRPTS
ncbi:hypothetical protein PPACK8108_LOCUS17173 [Phakopsora pachyrhizi]|uniref:Uncharacterized protein n=1 Tax=Phakopsora pachyrhizi TaxID=170000 RepID=A0AAV0BCI1_PHAPC|nr:hypothetical protein PPACK8108_LOCUS17173 [Phakopsora pachyrhizi]